MEQVLHPVEVPDITRCAILHRSTSQPTGELCSSPLPKSRDSMSAGMGRWARSFPARGAVTSPLSKVLMSITQGNCSGENTERKVKSSKPNRKIVKYSVIHCLAYR